MLRVTCDSCGRDLPASENHHVVKIEVFAVREPAELTEADLDKDHMEALGDMLQDMEVTGHVPAVEPRSRQFRYDLCDGCRARFVRDPLGREVSPKFHFSKN